MREQLHGYQSSREAMPPSAASRTSREAVPHSAASGTSREAVPPSAANGTNTCISASVSRQRNRGLAADDTSEPPHPSSDIPAGPDPPNTILDAPVRQETNTSVASTQNINADTSSHALASNGGSPVRIAFYSPNTSTVTYDTTTSTFSAPSRKLKLTAATDTVCSSNISVTPASAQSVKPCGAQTSYTKALGMTAGEYDPVFSKPPEKNLKYVSKTQKVFKMERVFIQKLQPETTEEHNETQH